MIRSISWAVAVTAAVGLLVVGAAVADGADEGYAPDFALKSVGGPNLRLSEYRSEVVMLAFWASWCGDCRSQLDEFRQLYASYQSVGFELLAVNMDADFTKARDAAENLKLEFPVLHDGSGRVGELYAVNKLPLVVFVDREGFVRDIIEGFDRSSSEIYLSRLRGLLRE